MKILVTDYFFKTIPVEKNENLMKKIYFFQEMILRNKILGKDLPKGFWIKKINGKDLLFEFRVNNGDRIFFILEKNNIILLLFSSHDMGIKKAKRKSKYLEDIEELIKFNEDNEVIYYNKAMIENNNLIMYEIINDMDFIKNFSNKKYKYYYLNNDQQKCLKENPPYFVGGSAGSGKSTITLRKVLNLEENNEVYKYNKIIYLTANEYLKDNSKEQYEEYRDRNKNKIVEFFTVKSFFSEHLGIKEEKISGFKDFKKFLKFSFPNYKKIDISIEEIYSEINGLIKGLMSKKNPDNWKRDIEKSIIEIEDYINLNNKYTVLDMEKRKNIYQIAEKYNEWLKKEELYDLNDLAILNLKENTEKYDFIVIDEIQDLTEVQIFSIFSISKIENNIFLAGDIHQMINTTFFSIERIKNLFFTEYKKILDVKILTKNYRSCKKIVEISNYFSDLRKEYIGNLGMDDYKENSIQKNGDIILTKIDYDLIKKAQEDVNYAIIVSNEESKENLLDVLENKHRVFTIQEIKGLEYSNIICYNLSSDYLVQWEKIFNKEAKKDQRYRKYFNIFYVGITRAQEKLIIMEKKLEENKLLKKLKDFLIIEEKVEIVPNDINLEVDRDNWLLEGMKLYKLERVDEAQYAFEKAGEPFWIIEHEIKKNIERLEFEKAAEKLLKNNLKEKGKFLKKLLIDKTIETENYILSIKFNELFNLKYKENQIKLLIDKKIDNGKIEKNELQKLLPIFLKNNNMDMVGKICYCLGNYKKALTCFEITKNLKWIKKSREEILKDFFEGREKLLENIKKFNDIVGRNINSVGKDKFLPIQLALKEKNFLLFEMILFLEGNPNILIKNRWHILEYSMKKVDYSWEEEKIIINLILKYKISLKNKEHLNLFVVRPKIFKYLIKEGYLKNEDIIIQYIQVMEIKDRKIERNLILLKKIIKNNNEKGNRWKA